MRQLLPLLLLISPLVASATSIVCNVAGYPKDFLDPIEYHVDKVFPKSAAPTEAPAEITYAVLLSPTFDGKPLESAFVEVLDNDVVNIQVPLQHHENHVPEWRNKYLAFLHTKPISYKIRVVAVYGRVCSATLHQVVP